MPEVSLRGILEDFVLQDSSLMDHLWHRIPIYSRSEIIARIISFFILLLPLWLVLKPMSISSVIVVLLIIHFINWFFNGHGYQIFYSIIGLKFSSKKAVEYMLKLKGEAEVKCLHVMIYGSWSRDEATCSSDIDVFIVNARRRIVSGLRLAFISLKYRLFAAAKPLSVDIYVIDRVEYLEWRRHAKPEERPIILNDPTGVIGSIYKESGTGFNDFLNAIMRVYKSH